MKREWEFESLSNSCCIFESNKEIVKKNKKETK